MTEPKRLLESTESRVEQNLLRSALAESAPVATRARALAVVDGVFAGHSLFCGNALRASNPDPSAEPLATQAAASQATAAQVAKSSGLAAVKLGAVLRSAPLFKFVAVVGLVAAGVAVHRFTRPGPMTAPTFSQESLGSRGVTPATRVVPAPIVVPAPLVEATPPVVARPAVEGPAEATREASPAPRAARHHKPPANVMPRSAPRAAMPQAAAEAPKPEDALAAQLALLARARERLGAGAAGDTVRLLDDYARRFPDGSLRPEAEALKRRALEQAAKEHWVDIERAAHGDAER